MKIVLYTFNYRKNDIVKNLNTSVTFNNAVLRYPTNHLNPIVRIDLGEITPNNTSYPTYNYAYIEDFGQRYYFIQNITAMSNTIFDLYLHVDVLFTYIGKTNSLLRSTTAFIERNEYTYDRWFMDERINFKNKNSVIMPTPVNDVDNDSGFLKIVFKSMMYTSQGNTHPNVSDNPFVLVVLTSSYAQSGSYGLYSSELDKTKPFPYAMGGGANFGSVSYLLTARQAHEFCEQILVDDEKASFVKLIKVLPFTLPLQNTDIDNTTGTIRFGNNQTITLSGDTYMQTIYKFTGAHQYRFFRADLSSYIPTDFKTNNGFKKIELYLPYYGWEDIDANALLNNPNVKVYYTVNFNSGSSSVQVALNDKLYSTHEITLGVDVPINSTNAYENEMKRNSIQTNAVVGEVTSILSFVVGAILTGTGVGSGMGVALMVGGASGFLGSVGNMIAQGMEIFDYGTKNLTSTNDSIYCPDIVYLRITQKEAQNQLSGAWLSENGRVLKDNKVISTLRGYTEFGKCEFNIGSVEEEKELEELTKTGVHFPTTTW